MIFNDKKTGKENLPGRKHQRFGILHSIKNLQFFGCRNTKVLVGNPLYCNEHLPQPEMNHRKNNKSFDDLPQVIKKRRRVRKQLVSAKLRINGLKQHEIFISRGTMKLFKTSGMRILQTLLEKEKCFPTPLANHEISSSMRAKMVDWMIEVFAIYKKHEDTYFQAVYLLDKYLCTTENMFEDSDIHLIGLGAMYSASKYLDYEPISIEDICEKISHNAFGPKCILKTEMSILK